MKTISLSLGQQVAAVTAGLILTAGAAALGLAAGGGAFDAAPPAPARFTFPPTMAPVPDPTGVYLTSDHTDAPAREVVVDPAAALPDAVLADLRRELGPLEDGSGEGAHALWDARIADRLAALEVAGVHAVLVLDMGHVNTDLEDVAPQPWRVAIPTSLIPYPTPHAWHVGEETVEAARATAVEVAGLLPPLPDHAVWVIIDLTA